jgi:hypothetical protein
MDSAQAARTLNEIEGVRTKARGLLDAAWFPLLVWGTIELASAPFTQIAGGDAVGFYWVVAGPLGFFVTFVYFRGRELDLGMVSRHKVAYIVTAVAIGVGSMALGIAGQGDMLSAVGPVFVVAAGLAAFAALDRSLILAVSTVAMVLLGAGLLLVSPADATFWAAVGEGAILMLTALVSVRS